MKDIIKASIKSAAVKEAVGIPSSIDTIMGRLTVVDFTKAQGVHIVLGQFVDSGNWIVAWSAAPRADGKWSWQQGHYFMDDAASAQTFFKKRYVQGEKTPDEWGKAI